MVSRHISRGKKVKKPKHTKNGHTRPRVRHSCQRATFVLRALFSMRAPFTINVPLTILDGCLPIDYLFQIAFDGLFVSDNIYVMKLFNIISITYMH